MSISSLDAVKTGCSAKLQFRASLTAAKLEFRVTFSEEVMNRGEYGDAESMHTVTTSRKIVE